MKKTILIVFSSLVLFLYNEKSYSQSTNTLPLLSHPSSLNDIQDQSAVESFLQTAVIFFPVNPVFLIENKKFYVGVTKEFSIGKFPFGRFAVEYSFIFRETRLNHLRASYNFDIPISAGDIAAFFLTLGGGYFTDFDKNGYFPQVAFSLVVPASDNVAALLYVKARNTFMTDKSKSDIFDFSLGIATAFYF